MCVCMRWRNGCTCACVGGGAYTGAARRRCLTERLGLRIRRDGTARLVCLSPLSLSLSLTHSFALALALSRSLALFI